jgi:hypothetical protein
LSKKEKQEASSEQSEARGKKGRKTRVEGREEGEKKLDKGGEWAYY